MSEGDYEYECMRCELLGLPRPEKVDRPPQEKNDEEGEDASENVLDDGINSSLPADEDIELKDEQLKNASGGLDELNSILSMTQKKLNRFKVVCGSLTNLLKLKVGKNEGSPSECSSRGSIASDTEGQREDEGAATASVGAADQQKPHDLDVSNQVNSQIDKLDSLIMKAERAHISMNSQNKQMKSLLK